MTSVTRLRQSSPGCSDISVIPAGWENPAYRLLLPEHIFSETGISFGGVHTILGRWNKVPGGILGKYSVGETFEISVDIKGLDTYVDIEVSIENLAPEDLTDVRMVICSSVNHLPGNPDWSNRLFIPDEVSEDRDAQGRYWYQHLTPDRLMALDPSGWFGTHPYPENPDPDLVPRYSFVESTTDDTLAYAVQSLDGKWIFYQAWDRPSRHATPCPGNACMHLHPLVSSRMGPGENGVVRGRCGMFQGDWEELYNFIHNWLSI